MRKATALIFTSLLMLSLFACGKNQEPAATQSPSTAVPTVQTTAATEATEPTVDAAATAEDIAFLDGMYAGRQVHHGEMHDHANTGGTSDGKQDLNSWRTYMSAQDMDFATIVDHKQSLHMYLEEWDEAYFIGGSEAMTLVQDLEDATYNKMHYNMIFTDPKGLEEIVTEFQEFLYIDNHFSYPTMKKERVMELAAAIREKGGMFVHVHPKANNYIVSENPLDYWFGDETGLEVFYGYSGYAPAQGTTERNYKLWTDLLAMGKRVWATAGSDKHNTANTDALTTVYTAEANGAAYLERFRQGDFVCGPVGIRMAIGDATMGGQATFDGNRVVFSVGDFHPTAYFKTDVYRVDLLDDQGVVFSQEFDPTQTTYFAVDAEATAKFYRVEVHNVTTGRIHAIGNPIWNQ